MNNKLYRVCLKLFFWFFLLVVYIDEFLIRKDFINVLNVVIVRIVRFIFDFVNFIL